MILAIDPGTEESALIRWSGAVVDHSAYLPNAALAQWLRERSFGTVPLVIEKIESFGMAVGESTFTTVYWVGIFAECYGLEKVHLMGRKAVKIHHCHTARATDSNIRAAIMDRFGGQSAAVGKKANPGPLFGITSHKLAALALAMTWAETQTSSVGLTSD